MNKVITYIIVLFAAAAFISSCANGSKMKNRHYQQWSDQTSEASESEKTNEESAIVYIEPSKLAKYEILNESISIHEIAPVDEETSNENSQVDAEVSTTQKDDQPYVAQLFKSNFKKQIKSSLFPSPAPASGDLSLLWIVIIILLILWALGLISGNFGGLVHLLLVIALILLILWLLKII
jgi:hypothetical protein